MIANDKNIIYNTKIFEEKSDVENDKEKNYKIIVRELKQGKDRKIVDKKKEEKLIWTVILRYKVDDRPQEVIMGTLGEVLERKEKAKTIIKLIEKQLKENSMEKKGYDSFEQLFKYIKGESIPFSFTLEGMDVLSSKSKDNVLIERTVIENRHGEMQNIYSNEDMERIKEKRNSQLSTYIREQKKLERWNERKSKILDRLEPLDKEKFLEGERITQFIREQEDILSKRELAVRYLTDDQEEISDKENSKSKLLKGYIKIKEKGLAIDAKMTLETIENEYYKSIRENSGDITEAQYKGLELIDSYKNFFDLVKMGKDWNARLVALKLKKINFDVLEKLFTKYRGEDIELLEYLKLKEKMINNVGTDTIELDYNQSDSVKELYDFLLHSSIREKTKSDDEFLISRVYEEGIKKELLEQDYDSLELYNHYAKKSGMYTVELPDNKNLNVNREKTSNVVKEILDGSYNDSKQNKEQEGEPEK